MVFERLCAAYVWNLQWFGYEGLPGMLTNINQHKEKTTVDLATPSGDSTVPHAVSQISDDLTWPSVVFFFGEQEASDHLGGFSSTALDNVPSDRSSWSTCRENTGWGNQIWLDGFSIAHHNTYHSTYVGDRVCRVHQQGLTRVRCDPDLCELWYEVMGRAVDTGYTRVCPRNGRMKSDWIQPADMEASCRLDRRTCRINHTYCNFSEEKDTHFLFLPLAVAFFFLVPQIENR